MCGIIGMAGNLSLATNKMFRDMLIFDTVRGMDSTGVLAVPYQPKDYWVEKQVGTPESLFAFAEAKHIDDRGMITGFKRILLGHNRAATRGSITAENAHPFDFERLVGVHNGSLWDTSELTGDKKFDVDSQMLYHHINDKGIEDAWKNFQGPAALVWWDKEDDVIRMVRNQDRPLFLMKSKREDIVFWASEPWMIKVAAERNNVDLFKSDEGAALFWSLKPNHLYEVEATMTKAKWSQVKELEEAPVKKSATRTQTNSHGTGTGNYQGPKGIYQPNHPRPEGSETPRWLRNDRAKRRHEEKAFARRVPALWSHGTDKADKDTRGREITIKSYSFRRDEKSGKQIEFVRAEFLSPELHKFPVYIVPTSLKDWEEYSRFFGRNVPANKFKTTSRMRTQKNDKGEIVAYLIGSEHIERVEDNVIPFESKRETIVGRIKREKEERERINGKQLNLDNFFEKLNENFNVPVIGPVANLPAPKPKNSGIYQTYFGFATKAECWQAVLAAGQCCAWCNTVVDKPNLRGIHWMAKDTFLCSECAKSPNVLNSIGVTL